jgi:hypothetical protein
MITFFHELTFNWGGSLAFSDLVNIPAGKMLVVEFVSLKAFIPTGESITAMQLLAEKGNTHSLVWQLVGSQPENSLDVFVASQQIRMYLKSNLRIELISQSFRDMTDRRQFGQD